MWEIFLKIKDKLIGVLKPSSPLSKLDLRYNPLGPDESVNFPSLYKGRYALWKSADFKKLPKYKQDQLLEGEKVYREWFEYNPLVEDFTPYDPNAPCTHNSHYSGPLWKKTGKCSSCGTDGAEIERDRDKKLDALKEYRKWIEEHKE